MRDEKSLRVKVTEKSRALKNSVKSFDVAIIESKDPTKQLYYTATDVARELESLFNRERGFKAQVTLKITFKKTKVGFGEDDEGEVYFEFKNAYFNSITFTIMNSDQIIDALDQASEEIKNKVAVWLSEVLLGYYINIVKYLPLRSNSYMPLPEELRNSKKGLINLKNEDDKCFSWCHVRHLNPQKRSTEN